MRILLSLYACEPYRGSEPGVGWAWALEMSKRQHTYCLTRANNRKVIEAELINLGFSKMETEENGVTAFRKTNDNTTIRFIFIDLPNWILKLKKLKIINSSLYYLMWQFKARNYFDSLNINVDIIHHVTFNSFVVPGVWWDRKEKVVLGPLGGTSICANHFLRVYPLFPRIKEFLRGLTRKSLKTNIFFNKANKNADIVLLTDKKMIEKLQSNSTKKYFQLIETAIPETLTSPNYSIKVKRENQFVWAGTMDGHKALEITLRAYAKAFGNNIENAPIIKIYGIGPNTNKMIKLAQKLKIYERMEFNGKTSQINLWEEARKSIALIFSSVRDTSGNVALEAMANGTPVICFDHQGIGTIATEDTSIKIQPTSWDTSINDFSKAMIKLTSNPELVDILGENARKHVLENYTWNKKFDFIESIYSQLN